MTPFYKIIEDGFIIGIGTNGNDSVTEITETEYNDLLSIIHIRPTSPIGYNYKLKADTLEWELVELPPIENDATESDYIDALNTLGVDTNEEN